MTGIPGKTGVVYTLDRETGEFLWATPTIAQNVISDIDGATGSVTENAELIFTDLGQEVLSCPSWGGGKNWPAGAYSPLTNTMYFPMQNTCARVPSTMEGGLAIYRLAARFQLAPGTDDLGSVWADFPMQNISYGRPQRTRRTVRRRIGIRRAVCMVRRTPSPRYGCPVCPWYYHGAGRCPPRPSPAESC